jgi:hypothetical protein
MRLAQQIALLAPSWNENANPFGGNFLMKHLVPLLIVLALGTSIGSAQKLPKIEPCKVTPDKMPKIRGLYLGMTFAEVKTIFKNLVTKPPEENGLRVAVSNEILLPQFLDVQSITLVFVDDELHKLELTYKSGSTDFSSIEDYASKLSDSLTVPKASWMYRVTDNGGLAEAKCYGFDVTGVLVSSEGGQGLTLKVESIYIIPTMLLRDYELEKRKKQKTNNFKP